MQHIAFFHAHFFGKAARSDVAADNFNRDDFYFFAQLFAVAELFDDVVRDAVFGKQIEEKGCNGVVHNALIHDSAVFGAV